jgi:hypothetical protein
MISPARRLPAAPILHVSVTAVRRAIDIDHRNMAMHFLSETNFFCILLPIIPYAADRHAWGQKVCFLVNTCAFYSAVASNQHALTPAIRQYIFCRCRPRPHHVLARFWTRGWSARHCHVCRWRRGGRGKYLVGTIHRYIIEYSLDKIILREKNIILLGVVIPSHIAEMVSEGSKCLFLQCEKRHSESFPATNKFKILLT